MFPNYPLLSLIARLDYSSNIYYAEVTDEETVELLRRLSYFNLIDEITLYIFPISYKQGIPLYSDSQQYDWKLCGAQTFRNGICRLVYRMNIHFKPYFCICAYTEGRLTPSSSAVRVILYPVSSSV